MSRTVAARAAEQVFGAPVDRPRKRRRPRSGRRARAWAREELGAFDALQSARAFGDAGLTEEARRAFTRLSRRPGRWPRARGRQL